MKFKRFSFLILVVPVFLHAQEYTELKSRYDTYLNYHGNLDKVVEVTKEEIVFHKNAGGKKEFVVPKSDWKKLAALIGRLPADSLEKIYSGEISLEKIKEAAAPEKKKSLKGLRVVIDPGHIAGTMEMARTEQKYLHFTRENFPALLQDSVDIAEGVLTYQTAGILKKMLEEKGAVVSLTRGENKTTFGITYDEWIKTRKKKTLDSLLAIKKIAPQKYKWLTRMNKKSFFVEFFKDFELQNRAKVINDGKADLVVIIHYNVNEKNVPWLKPSDKDFCMAFIPGCIIPENLETTAGKINFLRLLLTGSVNESEKISALLVNELSKQLNVPVAKTADATYLSEHCTATNSAGVYCRNLALCRLVKGTMMYGECLYQDDEKECYELTKNTENFYGVQTNKRVTLSAKSFFNAIEKFYSE